jgi:hypothetical protein
MRGCLQLLALAGVFCFVLVFPPASRACPDVPAAVAAARNGDQNAIAELRGYGPGGLHAFIEASREDLERYRANAAEGAGRLGAGDRWANLVGAIDAIAGQYDAAWSELYWFTDFEAAREIAQRSGKPILSLRLLGRLDEELSCANSRFFRSTLYANERVAALLRDRFVLHWESVRPAPVITIDYGDGRTLKTTITGNSIHYVLTADGTVVDALPGLWSPEDFQATLSQAADAAMQAAAANENAGVVLAAYRERQVESIDAQRVAIGLDAGRPLVAVAMPVALAAQVRTASKARVELGMARHMDPLILRTLAAMGEDRWQAAALKLSATEFDARSAALMRATLRPITPAADPSLWARVNQTLGRSVAADSLRNRLGLRRDVLSMLAASPDHAYRIPYLNMRVYAEVFLTPDSDPWLGMYEPATFSGLWGGPAHNSPSQQAKLAN